MRNQRKVLFLLLIGMISFIYLSTIRNVNADIQDYDKVGLEDGKRYEWTITSADPDAIEEMLGEYSIAIREDNQIIYEIEKVIELDEGYDEDNWTVEYESWDLEQDFDDDGIDDWDPIYKDPDEYEDDLEDLFWDCDPDEIHLRILFIPLDADDFLNDTCEIWFAYGNDGTLTRTGSSIKWEYDNFTAELDYDNDGVLEKLDVEFDGDTCYILELTNVGGIPWLSWQQIIQLLWIVILSVVGAVAAVVVVVLVKKRSKLKFDDLDKKRKKKKKKKKTDPAWYDVEEPKDSDKNWDWDDKL